MRYTSKSSIRVKIIYRRDHRPTSLGIHKPNRRQPRRYHLQRHKRLHLGRRIHNHRREMLRPPQIRHLRQLRPNPHHKIPVQRRRRRVHRRGHRVQKLLAL